MLRRASRHRLGLTVDGASSPSTKAYSPRFHSTVPLSAFTTPSGTGAISPRPAASKSRWSANGSRAAIAALAARVAGSASRAASRCDAGTGTADAVVIALPLIDPTRHSGNRHGQAQAFALDHPEGRLVLPRRRGRHVLWNAGLQAREKAARASAPGRHVAGTEGRRRHARPSA